MRFADIPLSQRRLTPDEVLALGELKTFRDLSYAIVDQRS